jgi:hypothetical protein
MHFPEKYHQNENKIYQISQLYDNLNNKENAFFSKNYIYEQQYPNY